MSSVECYRPAGLEECELRSVRRVYHSLHVDAVWQSVYWLTSEGFGTKLWLKRNQTLRPGSSRRLELYQRESSRLTSEWEHCLFTRLVDRGGFYVRWTHLKKVYGYTLSPIVDLMCNHTTICFDLRLNFEPVCPDRQLVQKYQFVQIPVKCVDVAMIIS